MDQILIPYRPLIRIWPKNTFLLIHPLQILKFSVTPFKLSISQSSWTFIIIIIQRKRDREKFSGINKSLTGWDGAHGGNMAQHTVAIWWSYPLP